MIRFREADCAPFVASDGTLLREILHPRNTGIDLPYSVALASLEPGACSQPHHLLTSTEVYIVRTGNGVVHLGDESAAVEAGDIIVIPPGTRQHIENTGSGDLSFLCLVSPPWRKEDDCP